MEMEVFLLVSSINDGIISNTVLDISSVHGLNSNKSGYLRDSTFNEDNRGFIEYLFWNVTFNGNRANGTHWRDMSLIRTIV